MRQKPPCCVNFWSRKYNNIVLDRKIFMAPFSATKEVRLQVLQWKIIHNIYPTQILLNKMGKSTDSNCRYCGQRDFIEHFFCSCPSVVAIWMTVENKVSVMMGRPVTLSEQQKLLGVTSPDFPELLVDRINHILLVTKMCVSKFKYGDYNNLRQIFDYETFIRKLTTL